MTSYVTETEKEVSKAISKTTPCFSTPMKTCLAISVAFFFNFTAYLAVQNLQSSLNKAEHLGVASLSVLYGTIIIFGTLAPTILRLLGVKNVLLTAWVIYAVYIACNFYPTWATLIPSSALVGAVAGPMWTAQGLYITSAGESFTKMLGSSTEEALHASLSKFNGFFFMFYEVSGVSGNLISSLVLFSADVQNSTNKNLDKMCGIYASELVSNVTNNNSTSVTEEPDNRVVYILLSIFMVCTVVCFVITAICLPKLKLPESGSKEDQRCSSLYSCLTIAVDKRMVVMLPLFMAQAMAVGVLYGDYTRDFITCPLGVQWVGYIMAAYGMFCAIFSISINSLARYVGRFILIVVAIFADTATLVAMLLWTPRQDDHIGLFFLIPVVSGLSEGIVQAQFYTLVAQVFSNNKTPAFATYHTSKATSFTITFALSTFVCLRYRLYIAISLYVLGLAGYVATELHLRRRSHDDTRDKMSTDNGEGRRIFSK